MFEDCPFNLAISKTKWVFFIVKTKNKLKHSIIVIYVIQFLLMLSFNYKHRNDNFDTLIWAIYLSIIWISIIVSFRNFLFNIVFRQHFFQTNIYLILYRGDAIQDVMKFIERAFNKLMVNFFL